MINMLLIMHSPALAVPLQRRLHVILQRSNPGGVLTSHAAELWGGSVAKPACHQGPAAPQETQQGCSEPSPCSCSACLKL